MGIDLSKFAKDIQLKIQAALSDDDKISAAEFREMNLSEAAKTELMKQLAGNPGMIGDGFIGKTDSDSTFVFHENPKNGIVNLTDKALKHYSNKYPDKDIKEGFMQDGALYFRDSKGELVKDENNVFISEKIFVEEEKTPAFINKDGSINIEKFQEHLNNLPETDKDYQTLMKDIDNATKEQSYLSIDRFVDTQKDRFLNIYQAINNGDFSQAAELMYSYFQEECQGFDENVLSKIKSGLERLTGSKWAGPALYTALSYIAEHADNLMGCDENGIGYAERFVVGLDNVGKGLGDFIFSTEGLVTMGALATGEYLLQGTAKWALSENLIKKSASKIAPYIGAAIHSYFGAEGTMLVADGAVKVATGETLEEIAEGGQEIGHGLPLMGTAVRAGGALYKGLKGSIPEIITEKSIRKKIESNPDLNTEEMKALADELLGQKLQLFDDLSISTISDVIEAKLSSPKRYHENLKVINEFLSDERLYNNKNLQKVLKNKFFVWKNANGNALKIMKLYKENSKYNQNPFIQEHLGDIIENCSSSKYKQSVQYYLDIFADNMDKMDFLFEHSKHLFGADIHEYGALWNDASWDTFKIIIENDELRNNKKLMQSFKLYVEYASQYGGMSYGYSIEVLDRYMRKQDALKISEENVDKVINGVWGVENIVADDEHGNPEQFQALMLQLFNNPLFSKNKSIMDNVGDIVGSARYTNTKIGIERQNKLDIMKLYEEELSKDKELEGYIGYILAGVTKSNKGEAIRYCKEYKKLEILPQQIPFLLKNLNIVTPQQIQKANNKLGTEFMRKLNEQELSIVCQFLDVYKVKNLNEMSSTGKKNFIRALTSCNSGMFDISPELKEKFPLIPTDVDQYCGLMRATVKSLGIETNPLTPEQRITMFNHSMKGLSESLAELSDEEFAGLKITQDYSREEFIQTVREKIKDLSQLEKQKVYDYYGFEIHHKLAKGQRKEHTLTGYPVNLNNGKKLAEITSPETKAVVESLRQDVIRFSENNPIKTGNAKVDQLLNEVAEAMPEIRSMIGRVQHGNNGTKGAHDFDVMQHSLKVMQKIAQDPNFKKLNESDQRLMLLASLLHDITKAEGISDHTHATEGGFDTYYICKKLNLTEDEELKLFNLTRLHEWLNYVNKSTSKTQLTKRLQSVAFDMQHGNLFDMALIFTHADLKAVKADDTFHDTRVGNTRAVFDKDGNRIFDESNMSQGVRKSHGETADIYAMRIREYIHELKTTRPLTPTTKVPTMSEIRSLLKVNSDGSTQFKGVWVDKDGLVVIKVNDVEDWEGIGFPKGTTTKGIKANVKNHGEERHEVETGNFKLMNHGLDYPNQLVKFERFTLPDTKALLSITYSERPETKSRFFRPQGVGLDFDADHIHGGGQTDAGSGYGKTIDDFKKEYIFGGEREGDRRFTADIVKKATGMSDEEYIKFYDKNKNKSWSEIEPPELAEKLIKAYAEGIKSSVRGANRAYTEYYGDKVKRVNSTFAYSVDYNEKIDNPLEFLNRTELTEGEKNASRIGYEDVKPVSERTGFLREFSIEHDVPMLIYGD